MSNPTEPPDAPEPEGFASLAEQLVADTPVFAYLADTAAGAAPAASEPMPPAVLADAAPPAPSEAPRRRRRRGLVFVVTLTVVGIMAVIGGGIALGAELTRHATQAEQATALNAEIASRWLRLRAGALFPTTISYYDSGGAKTTATLAGIAPETSCQQALEPSAFEQVHAVGCAAMLRATYIDVSGTQVTTVGIAVMSSEAAALHVEGNLDPMKAATGLHAWPVSGTLAGRFGDGQRAADGAEISGPYLLLFTSGYTDGVPGADVTTNDDLVALGSGVLAVIQRTLSSHPSPCAMKDIKC